MDAPVVIIVGLFFVIGITVGVIVVVAMAAVRSDRQGRLDDPPEYELGTRSPCPGGDHRAPDERPSWPGDSESRYSGR